MDTGSLLLGAMNVFVGVLLVALSIPLLTGTVKRNAWYGVRFRQAYASEEDWQAINRYGARQMIRWAVVILGVGLATFFIPLENRPALSVALAFVPLVVVIPAVQSYLFARKRSATGK